MTTLLIWLQPALIYFYPILIGRALVLLAHKGSVKRERWLIPGYLALGSLVLFGMALVIRYVGMFDFREAFFPATWLLSGASLLVNLWFRPTITKQVVLLLAGAGILSGISYGIWTYHSPYSLNWDWYQHQTMARLIQQGQFSFFTSEVSDTYGFDSYPPFFHTLVAVAQYPVALSPEYAVIFWQATGYWHLMSVGLAAYALVYVLSRSHLAALLGLIMSVLTFDAMISMTSYFLLPQTLAAVMATFFLAKLVMVLEERHTWRWWEGLSAILFLTLMHYLVGLASALIVLGVTGFVVLNRVVKVSVYPIVGLAVMLVVAVYIALPKMDLSWLNQGEAQAYTYSLEQKLEVFERSYGYLMYGLVVLGVVFSLVEWSRGKALALLIFFGLILAVMVEAPYVLKLLTLLRFWLVAMSALGLYGWVRYIRNPMIKGGVLLATLLTLVVILVVNIFYWKAGILADGNYSHITRDDIEAAHVLWKEGENKQVLVVSDPATQFFMEGLAGVDTIGGAYMKPSERKKLLPALEQRLPQQLVEAIGTLEDGVNQEYEAIYVAISGRTLVWVSKPEEDRLGFQTNVWMPTGLTLEDSAFGEALDGLVDVELVYRSPYIWVFKIK
jgi:hypothetical protein